jgi:cobalt-zinc-cadmium efflux system outer membrane protein
MLNHGNKHRRVDFRLLLLHGLMATAAGCSVHHYHHFDESVAVVPVAALAAPRPLEQNKAQVASTNNTGPLVGSPLVPVSHQSSEPVSSNTQFGNKTAQLGKPTELGPQPEAKETQKEETGKADAPPSSVPLTFNEVISVTLQADPRIKAGLEAITQANADFMTSSLFPNPTLVTNGDLIPFRRFTVQQPGGPPELDIQVTYPVDWFLFGKRAAAMASAGLGVRQSEADFADLIRQRVAAAALAFYDVVEAKALLELARKDATSLSKLAAAIKKGVDAGGKTQVDYNRARLDLLASQQTLNEAEAAVVVAKAKLRSLLGRADLDPSFDVAGSLEAPMTVQPMPFDHAFELAQDNRPDIQSLRWQVNKAQADIVVEHRKGFPQVAPTIGYSRQYQQSLAVPDADSGFLSLSTTLPFFDRNQGNRLKAQSVAVQNNFNLQAGMVDLRSEIEQVDQELRTAYKKASAITSEQLKLATEVRDAITKAYEVGGRPLIEVLDAQRNYHETYRLYINSRADYWRAVYKFSAAIGKQVMSNDELPH